MDISSVRKILIRKFSSDGALGVKTFSMASQSGSYRQHLVNVGGPVTLTPLENESSDENCGYDPYDRAKSK